MQFIAKIRNKYGKIDSIWLMDRGVPTEATLEEMRELGLKYLVGSPRSMVNSLERKFIGQDWIKVQHGIRVKLATEGTDKFILTHSRARWTKEHAMRLARMRKVMKVLHSLDERIKKWENAPADERGKKECKPLKRDELYGLVLPNLKLVAPGAASL